MRVVKISYACEIIIYLASFDAGALVGGDFFELSKYREHPFFKGRLGGVYVPCINRMPGGVIVGDSGLCCVPAIIL